MINKQTIISSFDDKGTLLKWLKAVENALEKASATEFLISKKGNSTISFILKFADDTQLESGDITLEQGESVESASIVNGHLLLTLTNGEVLDAGELFNGNVNLNGNFEANSIIEKMNGYTFNKTASDSAKTINYIYAGVVKTGNKITFATNLEITRLQTISTDNMIAGEFYFPQEIGNKLIPTSTIGLNNVLYSGVVSASKDYYQRVEVPFIIFKDTATRLRIVLYSVNGKLTQDVLFNLRIEATFLLSDSLASN